MSYKIICQIFACSNLAISYIFLEYLFFSPKFKNYLYLKVGLFRRPRDYKGLNEDYVRNRDKIYLKINNSSMAPLVGRLLFSLKTCITPSGVNRANDFLEREAFICLEPSSFRADSFSQTPISNLQRERFLL